MTAYQDQQPKKQSQVHTTNLTLINEVHNKYGPVISSENKKEIALIKKGGDSR